MSIAVRVENLGKKYNISRKRHAGSSYRTLRDVMADGTWAFFKKIFSRQKLLQSQTVPHEFWSLKDVSFEINHGDKVAIIGRNGAGKSTLLKVLSQITEPTTGTVSLYGRVSSLLEVGTGFHPELTGRENIYLNGAILGMSHAEIKKQFDEIVSFSGVEDFLELPVKRFSSGMRMRLGFAVAAHLQSEILVVDEVLAVGDAEFQKKCIEKMDAIAKSQGRTILFVSHNMAAVQQLCNKALVLDYGQLVFAGGIDAAIKHYDALTAREGTGFNLVAKHEAIELLDSRMAGAPAVGDDWHFALTFRATAPIKDAFFDFGIYNEKVYPIVHHMAQPVKQYFDIRPGTFTINVTIPRMMLNAGSYQLIAYLATRDGEVIYEAIGMDVAAITAPAPSVGPTALLSTPASVTVTWEEGAV